jgi:hypothetical protein
MRSRTSGPRIRSTHEVLQNELTLAITASRKAGYVSMDLSESF